VLWPYDHCILVYDQATRVEIDRRDFLLQDFDVDIGASAHIELDVWKNCGCGEVSENMDLTTRGHNGVSRVRSAAADHGGGFLFFSKEVGNLALAFSTELAANYHRNRHMGSKASEGFELRVELPKGTLIIYDLVCQVLQKVNPLFNRVLKGLRRGDVLTHGPLRA